MLPILPIFIDPNIFLNYDATDYFDPLSGWPESSIFDMSTSASANFAGGGDFGYLIRGDYRANIIQTDIGTDYIDGGAGNDLIYAGGYSDVVQGGAGNDTIYGQHGVDLLMGGSGNDVIYGGNAVDLASGYLQDSSKDYLQGGSGNDVLIGGRGADDLDGGTGIDMASYVNATEGVRASLLSSAANTGQAAGDTYQMIENLRGSAYGDILTGNTLANTLVGDGGSDVLEGGGGADMLFGGASADTFVYSALSASGITASTRDTIRDWAAGDRINVNLIDANGGVAGNQNFVMDAGGAFSAGEIRVTTSGGNTLVSFNTDADIAAEMTIQLSGIHVLNAASFVF